MAVYFIRAGVHGPVKIGRSTMPAKRLADLQTPHWEPLMILRLFRGGEEEEAQMHQRFAALHIRGEWFQFCITMLGDVGLVETSLEEVAADLERKWSGAPDGCDRKLWRQCVQAYARGVLGEWGTPIDAYRRFSGGSNGGP